LIVHARTWFAELHSFKERIDWVNNQSSTVAWRIGLILFAVVGGAMIYGLAYSRGYSSARRDHSLVGTKAEKRLIEIDINSRFVFDVFCGGHDDPRKGKKLECNYDPQNDATPLRRAVISDIIDILYDARPATPVFDNEPTGTVLVSNPNGEVLRLRLFNNFILLNPDSTAEKQKWLLFDVFGFESRFRCLYDSFQKR
jgi:hypothetical protein